MKKEPWFTMHRIGDTDQHFYREIISILNENPEELAAKGQPISQKSNGICCGNCANASESGSKRFYRHREQCGNVQAYIFDDEGLTEKEDGFEDRFIDGTPNTVRASGLTFKWQQGTDRKAQYLMPAASVVGLYSNAEYKWEPLSKESLTYKTPLAEKRVYHGKLKADWTAPRGNRALQHHPIRNGIAEKWKNGGFAIAFVQKLRERAQGPALSDKWWEENLPPNVGWKSGEHCDLIAKVLQDDFRIPLHKNILKKLIKFIPTDSSSVENKAAALFRQMKWEPLQFSLSIEEFLMESALAEKGLSTDSQAKASSAPTVSDFTAQRELRVDLKMSAEGFRATIVKMSEASFEDEYLREVVRMSGEVLAPSSFLSSAKVSVSAVCLMLSAYLRSDGHRLPINKIIIKKYVQEEKKGEMKLQQVGEQQQQQQQEEEGGRVEKKDGKRATAAPRPRSRLSATGMMRDLARSFTGGGRRRGTHGGEGAGRKGGEGAGRKGGEGAGKKGAGGGAGAGGKAKEPKKRERGLVYYEIADDWTTNTRMRSMDRALWAMIATTEGDGTAATARGTYQGTLGAGLGSSEKRNVTWKIHNERNVGNRLILEVELEVMDVLDLEKRGFTGISATGEEAERLLVACVFTIAGTVHTGRVLGYSRRSKYGFEVEVPESYFDESREGTQPVWTKLQVRALMLHADYAERWKRYPELQKALVGYREEREAAELEMQEMEAKEGAPNRLLLLVHGPLEAMVGLTTMGTTGALTQEVRSLRRQTIVALVNCNTQVGGGPEGHYSARDYAEVAAALSSPPSSMYGGNLSRDDRELSFETGPDHNPSFDVNRGSFDSNHGSFGSDRLSFGYSEVDPVCEVGEVDAVSTCENDDEAAVANVDIGMGSMAPATQRQQRSNPKQVASGDLLWVPSGGARGWIELTVMEKADRGPKNQRGTHFWRLSDGQIRCIDPQECGLSGEAKWCFKDEYDGDKLAGELGHSQHSKSSVVGKEGVGEEGSGAQFLAYLDTLMSIADAHFMSEMAEDENSLQDEHSVSLLTLQDGLYSGSLSTSQGGLAETSQRVESAQSITVHVDGGEAEQQQQQEEEKAHNKRKVRSKDEEKAAYIAKLQRETQEATAAAGGAAAGGANASGANASEPQVERPRKQKLDEAGTYRQYRSIAGALTKRVNAPETTVAELRNTGARGSKPRGGRRLRGMLGAAKQKGAARVPLAAPDCRSTSPERQIEGVIEKA
jgi:hypothetical protein